jgi:DNA-binding response OmpR family regulator
MAILDVMMPGMDGFEVLRELREQEHGETHLPVMLLTARAEDADQVRGLEGGADDYVTKPFSPIVLAARVRTLLKREGRAGAPLEQLGKLSVNELRREVMVENKPIDLTPKEYELLIYFKNNRAIALSRESILNAVWGYDYFGDLRTVDTHVKKLRAKLGECGTMIETVRGYGYRFEV